MLKGQDIMDMAAELVEIQKSKKDLIVPTVQMRMCRTDGHSPLQLRLEDGQLFDINNWPHSQISTYTNIPKQYYDRIKDEKPGLLTLCVNHGFQMVINRHFAEKKKHDCRMLRTINGNVRAFLSDRYWRLDCYDLLDAVFPILEDNRFRVISSQLTETRMYIKAITDTIQGEWKKGHIVRYGICISCSDVGCGSVSVEPLLYEVECTNGWISEQAFRRAHIGKSQAGDNIQELLTDETKNVSDKAFWMQVRDVVKGTMEDRIFQQNLNKLRDAADIKMENLDIPKVVDLTMKEVGITGEKVKNSIVEHLASGADGKGMTMLGLASSFTWAAHKAEDVDYETSTALEKAGPKIIELSQKDWRKIAA